MGGQELFNRASEIDAGVRAWNNRRPMEITLALLADAANISVEGKLNVLGAFSNIYASSFPARHPSMNLVFEFDASASESGSMRHIEVRLLDEDGKTLGTLETDFAVPQPERGRRIIFGAVLPLTDVVFERPGNHVFDVLINGDSKKQVPLAIIQLPTKEERRNDA